MSMSSLCKHVCICVQRPFPIHTISYIVSPEPLQWDLGDDISNDK
jgi:hypothetical protein